jgi:hypothetical protein
LKSNCRQDPVDSFCHRFGFVQGFFSRRPRSDALSFAPPKPFSHKQSDQSNIASSVKDKVRVQVAALYIELQPGEVVTHVNLGDSTRWTVESALSESGSDQIEHSTVP